MYTNFKWLAIPLSVTSVRIFLIDTMTKKNYAFQPFKNVCTKTALSVWLI